MELNVNALAVAGKIVQATLVKNNLFWRYLSRVLLGFFLVVAGLILIPVQETLGDTEIRSISLNPPLDGETYRRGEEITIILTFEDRVTVVGSDLFIDAFIGGQWRGPRFANASSHTVSFSYTVGDRNGHVDVGNITIGSAYNILRFDNGGKVQHDGKDVKKTFRGFIDSFKVDAREWIQSVTVSEPDNERNTFHKDVFLLGDEIFIDVTFEKTRGRRGRPFLRCVHRFLEAALLFRDKW